MTKVILLAVLLALIGGVIAVSGYARVEKPAVGGTGPLAIQIPSGLSAPDYHQQPSSAWWRTRHGEGVRDAAAQQKCLGCHNPQTSCNKCHAYVGVKPVVGAAVTVISRPATSVPTAVAPPPMPYPTLAPASATPTPLASPTEVAAATVPPTASPTTVAARAPSFAQDIVPILRTRCAACHGALGGWDASTYDRVVNSGEHKPVIVPGKPDDSLLIQKLLKRQTIGLEMPPGDLLSPDQVELFIRWVAAGAPNN